MLPRCTEPQTLNLEITEKVAQNGTIFMAIDPLIQKLKL
jgi:hypothetical protein